LGLNLKARIYRADANMRRDRRGLQHGLQHGGGAIALGSA
jgi:hypothetical protein